MKNKCPRFEHWLATAVSGIRFPADREEVRQELAAHLEDKAFDLMRIYPNLTISEAEEMALARMGDPNELREELARIHKPWLGYLSTISTCLLMLAGTVLTIELLVACKVVLEIYVF